MATDDNGRREAGRLEERIVHLSAEVQELKADMRRAFTDLPRASDVAELKQLFQMEHTSAIAARRDVSEWQEAVSGRIARLEERQSNLTVLQSIYATVVSAVAAFIGTRNP